MSFTLADRISYVPDKVAIASAALRSSDASKAAYSGHSSTSGKFDLSMPANEIYSESDPVKKFGLILANPSAAKEVFDFKQGNLAQKVSPAMETIANAFQQSSSGSASSGVAGSPASAEEIMVERNPVQIEGAPITSAVSGIQDQENRLNAWTEMMNNSAHQREIKDLIAAGLNPVLSARYGGADSGSVANVEPTSAVAAASGSGSGRSSKSGFLGLTPVSNPKTPLQMAYNLVVANGDKVVHAAKQIANAAQKME